MKKMIFKPTFIFTLVLLVSCDFNREIETYDRSLPWENLRESLDQLLVFELDCISIEYKVDASRFDEKYADDFLFFSSEILIENMKDSVLLNQEYRTFLVPEEWSNQSVELGNFSNDCTVYFTKLVESTSENVIFTYVYIPSLDSRYKILFTKDANNDWKLNGFGM